MSTKSVRSAWYDVRDWSGKILASPRHFEFEWCAKLAEALQILILPEHQVETMDFWRAVCTERYPLRPRIFAQIADANIVGKARAMRAHFANLAKATEVDDKSREQAVEICRCLAIVYDRSFRTIGRTERPEPLFDTYLGQPKEGAGRFRVYEGGKTA